MPCMKISESLSNEKAKVHFQEAQAVKKLLTLIA